MSAVMAKHNPFGERAGMKKAAEQEPQREILRVSRVLQELGFNVQLFGSGTMYSRNFKHSISMSWKGLGRSSSKPTIHASSSFSAQAFHSDIWKIMKER
jgi:hypothetical protein